MTDISPQVENGHIDIANEIAEAFFMLQLSGNQWRVLWVIIRQTWGWHKKVETITISFIAKKTGLKRSHVARSLRELTERNIVTKIGNSKGVSYGLNKVYDKWKVLPKLVTVTKIGNCLLPKRSDSIKETTNKETYIVIFNFWNSKEIIVHRKLSEKIKAKIKTALVDRTQEEIISAISNYSTVLKSSDHFWTYEWTLMEFLSRGIDKFVEEAHPLTNFLNEKDKQQIEQPSRREKENFI